MSYGYDSDGPQEREPAPEPAAGRGRRRKPSPDPEAAAAHSAAFDAQWEHSGLGWDPQAWNEAQRDQDAAGPGEPQGVQYPPRQAAHGFDDYPPADFPSVAYAQPDYAQPEYPAEPYPVEVYPREDHPAGGEYADDRYPANPRIPGQYTPEQFGGERRGFDRSSAPAEYTSNQFAADEYDSDRELGYPARYDYGDAAPGHERTPRRGRVGDSDPERFAAPPTEPLTEPLTEPRTEEGRSAAPGTAAANTGRAAFGAAGLAVVTGISALVATPVLAVVLCLSQVGLVVGWLRTAGFSNSRRTVGLVSVIALVAAALAYRVTPDNAPGAIGAALGGGFVFLAADQLFRREAGAGRRRSEALAAAATAAAVAVLLAGYLVTQRLDSGLAGACALAAAVAVLTSALVGGGTRPAGIVAGVAAAAALGALSAVTLGATAGAKGGALGGIMSGLFAVIAVRAADRAAAEGSDTRITSQVLPVALSAIGALIAAQVMR
jgi:hypothetical protein